MFGTVVAETDDAGRTVVVFESVDDRAGGDDALVGERGEPSCQSPRRIRVVRRDVRERREGGSLAVVDADTESSGALDDLDETSIELHFRAGSTFGGFEPCISPSRSRTTVVPATCQRPGTSSNRVGVLSSQCNAVRLSQPRGRRRLSLRSVCHCCQSATNRSSVVVTMHGLLL